ncbi:SusC/RagA family TonB-linked outer membrane protein [Sphingobacterium thalpophilum]|uniref:SusC/RagA family TonB-linked outer membrane protein n=1 Tax=Sphingobacterium thalpophilum TaxID=259 RepID=UPI0037DA5DB8
MKRKLLLILSGVMLSSSLWAQTKTISGKVTSAADGTSMSNVTVTIKGKSISTQTNSDGTFTINAEPGDILLFRAVGSSESQKLVGSGNVINVVLVRSEEVLDEVVVTAMGVKKEKRALGYAVQDIGSSELMKNKSPNLINSLAGKIAGVNVTQTSGGAGAGASIILRGGTSLQRDNQPLFVVDGLIYDNNTSINGNSGFDGAQSTNSVYSNRVMDINPEDIENVSVLKGPAAAALYGSRAAAGVIMITTKKGKEGTASVSVTSRFTSNWANRLPEQQNNYKRGEYQIDGKLLEGDATKTMGSWGAKFGADAQIYNNLKEFFRTGSAWDNSASLAGGYKNGSYYFSASDFRQKGIIPNSDYNKTTFRINADQKYGILKIGTNMTYSIADQLSSLTSSGLYGANGEGAVQGAYIWPHDIDMKHYLNEDGSKYRLFNYDLVQNDFDNPYWILYKMPRTSKVNRFTGTFNAKLDITSWWDLTYTVGIDRYTENGTRLTTAGSGVEFRYLNGLMSQNNSTYQYVSSNLMTSFRKKVKDFDFNLMLGTMAESTTREFNGLKAWNFILPGFYVPTNTVNTDRDIAQTIRRNRLVGVFGEFRASYKDIAYFTATQRNDHASTLPKENSSYYYPSLSGSVVFTELLPKNDILSFGKVRASWAKVGKDTEPYVTNTYAVGPEFTLYNQGQGVGFRNDWLKGNNILKPEISEAQEYGVDLKFLKSRFGLEFTYYKNRSINQLLQPRSSQATGYILMWTNAGDINNKGLELSLSGTPIKKENFKWDIMLNASRNKGKVENLLDGMDILYVTDVQVGSAKAASFNRGNFMAISGSQWLRSPDGQLVLNRETGMPTSDGLDTHEIGNREPKLFGGLNNSFQYKNWNLSFLLDYRIGGDVYNGTDYYLTTMGMSARSGDRDKLSISGVVKTGENPDKTPIYSETKTFEYEAGKMYKIGDKEVSGDYIINNYYWQSAYNLESANYMTKTNWLRLRSVTLSYSLPESVVKRIKGVKGATATFTGTNLWLWTNYKGMDPETSAAGSGAVGSSSVGIDYNGIPALSGVSFGLNVTF